MILIYSDESGTSYEIVNSFFKDGPFIIRGGLCIDDTKYFHLERMFIDLIDQHFGIEDWSKQEIHGNKLWAREDYFAKYSIEEIKSFFEELLQLLTKLHTSCIFGIKAKTVGADGCLQQKETAKANHAFLHCLEYHLARNNETGIIIADVMESEEAGGLCSKTNLDNLLFERMCWRLNPKVKTSFTIDPKFKFEAKSCCLLDQIHYVNSQSSIFIQLIDVINFILMRVLTYEYLFYRPSIIKADESKVPISQDTFKFFISATSSSFVYYDEKAKDVIFLPPEDFLMQTHSFFNKSLINELTT